MRKQYTISEFNLKDTCIFIFKIIMTVIYPFRKSNSHFLCNIQIFFFTKITQVNALSISSKPISCNCNKRILLNLFHFI